MRKGQRVRQIGVYSAYILFFSILQVTFPDALSLFGQVADFMLVFVVVSAYFFGVFDGMAVGLTIGLLRDILAGYHMGIGMLVFMFIGFLAAILFHKLFHRRLAPCFLQVATFTLFYKMIGHTVFFFIALLAGEHVAYLSLGHILFQSILPQILINLLIAVPMVLLLRFLGPYSKSIMKEKDDAVMEGIEGIWAIK